MNRTENLTEVYRTVSEPEAQVIRGLLESFGIPCVLRANLAPSVFVLIDNTMGGIRVMVPEHVAEEAMQLIEARNEAEPPEGDEENI
ncbi:MAG: DUF2007 domain-containing protein [Dehalococcoidales bacterium]|nr:DUF2007 domain-containing protein [Dehalococcoidales bacterium]